MFILYLYLKQYTNTGQLKASLKSCLVPLYLKPYFTLLNNFALDLLVVKEFLNFKEPRGTPPPAQLDIILNLD